jgi:hypothetical protein
MPLLMPLPMPLLPPMPSLLPFSWPSSVADRGGFRVTPGFFDKSIQFATAALS